MNNTDKLRVLIPHWIEHNHEHAEEFLGYLESAGDAKVDLQKAAEQIELANQALSAAVEKLGGALEFPGIMEHHEHNLPHGHDHEHHKHGHDHH